MVKIGVHLMIEGRVQGVWFRESTKRKAVSLGLFGWVKNRPDGTVEAFVEGPQDQVKKLVSWCHEGPPAAVVTNVLERQEEWRGEYSDFQIVF